MTSSSISDPMRACACACLNPRSNLVPTSYARSLASSVVAPLLAAYPLPSAGQDVPATYTGPDIASAYTGQFFAAFSNPSTLNATSVRLDYTPTSKLSLFVRGDYAPLQRLSIWSL